MNLPPAFSWPRYWTYQRGVARIAQVICRELEFNSLEPVARTAGQLHDLGKLLLAHPGARYPEGVFTRAGTTMHVSPGLGTTFVPFRFFARPEATELVLRCG